MIRRLLSLVFALAILVTPVAIAPSSVSLARAADTKDCVVYVTRTGERYHRAGCRYLRYSSRAVGRREAIAAGYTPCRVCGGSSCE
jgi:hypothetical protein